MKKSKKKKVLQIIKETVIVLLLSVIMFFIMLVGFMQNSFRYDPPTEAELQQMSPLEKALFLVD